MNPELVWAVLLAVGAFWLGACPFPVWIAYRFLGKDSRNYGDGNPGAANVFRAGNRRLGLLAVFLDVGKGVPFVYMSHALLGLSETASVVVGICAVLGHAFSPILGFRGGKAVAIIFGVLIALPQPDMLLVFTVMVLLGFLLLENDAWKVMLGPIGSVVYIVATSRSAWELGFMLFALAILTFKHRRELRTMPRLRKRLIYRHSTR